MTTHLDRDVSFLFQVGVVLFLIYMVIGCATLPPPPVGDTCILDVAHNQAICVPIASAVARQHVDRVDGTYLLPISQMDNYVSFSPDTWSQIEAYILKLKDQAQRSCK